MVFNKILFKQEFSDFHLKIVQIIWIPFSSLSSCLLRLNIGVPKSDFVVLVESQNGPKLAGNVLPMKACYVCTFGEYFWDPKFC